MSFVRPTSNILFHLSLSSSTHSPPTDTLITGSWDRTIRFWDSRAPSPNLAIYSTPERIYALDHVNNTLVVAMASRLFHIYDIRNMDAPAQQRESSLKFMTRSLACMPDAQGSCPLLKTPPFHLSNNLSLSLTHTGYATASVEGRIAVEYFDSSPASQDKKYAFKCHRQSIDEKDHVWPVNALAFHPTYHTFASAGSDGAVSIWDHKVKKRLRQYPKYPGPIAALAFNSDGSRLAVGVSYTWDEGEQGMKTQNITPSIAVRKVGEEVKVCRAFFFFSFLVLLIYFFPYSQNQSCRPLL